MAARFSASGKRIGRPPKDRSAEAAAPTAQEIAELRALKHFVNRYDAAGRGRRMASWNPPSSGPNVAINSGMQILRDRSSDTVRNDWSGTSIVQNWSTTLIGIAITPRFRRVKSKPRRQELTDLFVDFVKQADADCVLDLYGMQTLAVRSWIERGEMFARRRYRSADDNLAVPMQVQLLEADMVPNFDATTFGGMPVGNQIKSGIEINRRGKIVAYWVHKNHPGDGAMTVGGTPNSGDLVRVLAQDMLHMFEPKRIGVRRGVPEMSPILPRLRNVNDFEDVTLERQKIANLFVAFISRSLPAIDPTDPNSVAAALSGLDVPLDDGGNPLQPMKPGLLQELDDGQSVTFANPPEPATNYSDYMRTSHLGTAAGVGMPYELMSGDIRGVSDRALRVVMNEYRRFASQRQWQIVIPMFCQRIIEWFADAAVLAGKITLDEVADVIRVEHAPHGWEYLHPVQDVQGKALEVQNGFRSRSSVVSESGDDPEVVDQERADDAARERDLGLPVTGLPDGYADPGDEPEDEDSDTGPTPAQQVADAARQRASAVVAQQKAERDEAAAREAREQEIHQTMLELLGMQVDG